MDYELSKSLLKHANMQHAHSITLTLVRANKEPKVARTNLEMVSLKSQLCAITLQGSPRSSIPRSDEDRERRFDGKRRETGYVGVNALLHYPHAHDFRTLLVFGNLLQQ